MPTWRTLLRYWVTSLEALPSLAVSLVIWWLVVDDGSLRTYFWPMAKKNLIFFWGITYLVGNSKFKLVFQGPFAK